MRQILSSVAVVLVERGAADEDTPPLGSTLPPLALPLPVPFLDCLCPLTLCLCCWPEHHLGGLEFLSGPRLQEVVRGGGNKAVPGLARAKLDHLHYTSPVLLA